MNENTKVERAKCFISELREMYSTYAGKVRRMAPTTIKGQQVYLDRIFNGLNISTPDDLSKHITHNTVSRFVVEYSQTHGPGSCSWIKFTMRSFLNFCQLYGILDNNLSRLVPVDRRRQLAHLPKSIDDKSINAILNAINGSSPYDLRDSAIICMLITYGIRGVQLRQLCLHDIDWDNEVINFPAAKNGRLISQPITVEVGNRLAAYLTDGRPETPFNEVFVTLKGDVHPLDKPSHLSGMISRRFNRAKVVLPEGVSHGTHGFRHAFATRLVGQIPFKSLSDMLGHRDPSSTLLYSKVAFTALQEAALPWPEEN